MWYYLSNVRRYFKRRSARDVLTSAGGSTESKLPERHNRLAGGLFNNASNFVQHNPQNVDFSNAQVQQVILQTIMHGDATMERLLPYICEDASINSSARYPPPRCHEGTREKVGEKLRKWFHDPERRWKTMWLYGPAGTGKSAVAQTFAEYCEGTESLGSAYFFSRPNHRDKYETVVPTIVFQLATAIPAYRILLTRAIAADPSILSKTPQVQLRKLIIEPFTELRAQGDPITQKTLLIVLDGLDECHGLKGQLELVEMISEVNQLSLPFLWLVCSRPEPHLVYIFSKAIECDRHQLVIDADMRQDVEKFLRDGFRKMQIELLGMVDESWPPAKLFKQIVDIADGLFVLATAILGYIGNSSYATPNQRLLDFLAFMEHAHRLATDNPLEALDLLYSRILMDVPTSVMPATRRILHHCLYEMDIADFEVPTAQVLANLLCLDQHEFYNALRSLHSVLEIPSPDNAISSPLHMYHASFKDYLCSPSRAGKFFISEEEAMTEFAKSKFHWYDIILEDHVSDDEFNWRRDDRPQSIVPRLKWTSSMSSESIAQKVNYFTYRFFAGWRYLCRSFKGEMANMNRFLDAFKFQYMDLDDAQIFTYFPAFLNDLSQLGLPGTVLRTEAIYDLDKLLLENVKKKVLEMQSEDCANGMKTCLFWTDRRLDCLGRARLSCKAVAGQHLTASDCVLHASYDDTFDKETNVSEASSSDSEGYDDDDDDAFK
ncbi:hypothetical protein NP233_g4337 [Leucocoprinus birnbaumii]|uniref:Nephrocystin 3-like N-terminal domain-containing protein n=1 Tax=Leucocoprinus birnbaumii TaxID=56174 RepID=A0AAD5VWA1_9AGAR|nr:hypothetical protein NP233_g4337 [Leucocoprinus birnbaumii]